MIFVLITLMKIKCLYFPKKSYQASILEENDTKQRILFFTCVLMEAAMSLNPTGKLLGLEEDLTVQLKQLNRTYLSK